MASVELVAELHARAAELYQAAPWDDCNKKLGVLIPGCSWRLGVPMGNQGKVRGFCIDEYDTRESAVERQAHHPSMKLPAILYLREGDVPFADADAAATHGFEAIDGYYPVPVYPEPGHTTFSTTRPPKSDLEWMVRAIPAVIAFCKEHREALRRMAIYGETFGMLAHRQRLSTSFTTSAGALPACTVTVCFPPPAAERMPERAEVDDTETRLSQVGKRMRIYGLTGRPELNGKWCRLTAYRANKMRFAVHLEATNESVLLKPANLEYS